MIDTLTDKFYDFLIAIIDKLPEVQSFTVPEVLESGLTKIFEFVGWRMPFSYYLPLMSFILSLTAFRIVYSIFMRFKKN